MAIDPAEAAMREARRLAALEIVDAAAALGDAIERFRAACSADGEVPPGDAGLVQLRANLQGCSSWFRSVYGERG